MAVTPAERKRKEREHKRSLGLKPIELWVLPQDEQQIRDVERLSQEKARRLKEEETTEGECYE